MKNNKISFKDKRFKNLSGKANGFLIGCFVVILLIAGTGVAAAGYFGLIPSVSKILGTNKPKDLGIRYANIDVPKLHDRVGAKTVIAKELSGSGAETGVLFEGEKPAKYSIGSEELTALGNSPWKFFPFTDVQIKIAQDGTVETSAMLRADRLVSFAKSLGFSQKQVNEAIKEFKIPVTNVPVYAKGNFAVTNGKVEISAQRAEIGKIPLPTALIEQITRPVTSGVEKLITSFPGFSIKNLSFENGKMNFEGTVPLKQTFVTE
jgi:hypothetical protein